MNGLVPRDNIFSNLTVTQILVAQEKLAALLVEAQNITSSENKSITANTIVANTIVSNTAEFKTLTLTDTSNQLTLGNGTTILISAPTPVSNVTYTIPDVGANASFVMTSGAQTINGVKTFSTGILLPTTGGTPTELSYNEVLVTTIDFTSDSFAGTQPANIRLSRVGNTVSLTAETFLVAGNGTPGNFLATDAIPARFRPSTNNIIGFASVQDGLVATLGQILVATTGQIIASRTTVSGANIENSQFAGVGEIGYNSFSMSWTV